MESEQLELLMNSYKEQIQLNTKLLERQERFMDRLDHSTQQLIEAINAQTTGLQSTLDSGLSSLGRDITTEHGDINLRIYVALGGMVTILLTLITIWVTK